VVFAVDSIPAVFGVTRDPYLVYTSNIFAILGLRSLFFVLEDMLHRFYLLKYGLGVILCFVGAKMLLEHWYKIPPLYSLLVIGVILITSVLLSLRKKK
jgi:tellurite resistance protein TerC